MVLQVQHNRVAFQRTRLDDRVELLVDQPRIAPRHDVDADLAQRVEQPVRTGLQQTAELAVAEVQTHLESADLDSLDEHHGCTSPVQRP